VSPVLELLPLDQPRLERLRLVRSFERLDAGLLVRADDVDPLLRKLRSAEIRLAYGLGGFAERGIFRGGVDPVADSVGL
jgi:hypothetical protein